MVIRTNRTGNDNKELQDAKRRLARWKEKSDGGPLTERTDPMDAESTTSTITTSPSLGHLVKQPANGKRGKPNFANKPTLAGPVPMTVTARHPKPRKSSRQVSGSKSSGNGIQKRRADVVETVNLLLETIRDLEMRETEISNQQTEWLAYAKELMASGNSKQAITYMRQTKRFESQLQLVSSCIESLRERILKLEAALNFVQSPSSGRTTGADGVSSLQDVDKIVNEIRNHTLEMEKVASTEPVGDLQLSDKELLRELASHQQPNLFWNLARIFQ